MFNSIFESRSMPINLKLSALLVANHRAFLARWKSVEGRVLCDTHKDEKLS